MSTNRVQFQDFEGSCDVLFVAGEHSGDEHAAHLTSGILERHPTMRIAAVGGIHLERAGATLLHDLTESSVVGLVEVLKQYPYFKALFNQLVIWIEKHQPKVIVLVDYPGFNLRLAAELKLRGLSVRGGGNVRIYQYISPQIWAWKGKRRFKMAKILDEVGAIFPFEVDCYADTDLDVRFVGHPFCEDHFENPLQYRSDAQLLLLPGSRKQAVGRIFPLMLKAVEADPSLRKNGLTVIYPSEVIKLQLEEIAQEFPQTCAMLTFQPAYEKVAASAVCTSSGTMSLKCALAGIPGLIIYRAHPLTYWIGRRLVKIEYLGIANLLLNRSMYPEFIQSEASSEAISHRIKACWGSHEVIAQTQNDQIELARSLRPPREQTAVDRIIALWALASSE